MRTDLRRQLKIERPETNYGNAGFWRTQAERIRLPHAAGREVSATKDRGLHRPGRPEAAFRKSSESTQTGGGPAGRTSWQREDHARHGVRGRASWDSSPHQ